MLAPASGFYSTKGQGENQVRLAYVLNPSDLKEAVSILKEGLRAYLKTSLSTSIQNSTFMEQQDISPQAYTTFGVPVNAARYLEIKNIPQLQEVLKKENKFHLF